MKNQYPLPRTNDLFGQLGGARVFSKFGYHQLNVKELDTLKMSFQTRYGHYKFLVIPLEVMNAHAIFMNLMNWVFIPYLDEFVMVFIVLMYFKIEEDHTRHLRIVFVLLRNEKYKLVKCEFWLKSIHV